MPAHLDLSMAAPHLSASVAAHAEMAYRCAEEHGERARRLLVVDMGLPSSQQRLWAFDTTDPTRPVLILRDKVAHGAGSDPTGSGYATRFGNEVNSWMTSVGLYRIAEPFANAEGRAAFSLDGLDPGFNDEARDRHVVLHPSRYVPAGPGLAGRSQGCPSVSQATFDKLEVAGIRGGLLWIDGPEPALAHAPSLSCAPDPNVADAAEAQTARQSESARVAFSKTYFGELSSNTLGHSPWSS